MAGLIPRFLALGKGTKYLCYVLEEGELHSRMQHMSDEVVSERSFTKLEIVSSETSFDEDSLVHIRSAYNNKFLVLSTQDQNWVVAGAHEPEEDRSKWSCTLFRVSGNQNRLRLFLQSAGAEHGVQISEAEQCLTIVRNSTTAVEFNVTSLDSLAILPEHNVAFKGSNGKYLTPKYLQLHYRLQFESSDLTDDAVLHKSVHLENGDVRLFSVKLKCFWRKSSESGDPDWIWCDTTDPTPNNNDTVYEPIKLDTKGNSIALKSKGNGKYCTRHTTGQLADTLIASASEVKTDEKLSVVEPVEYREIYEVQYKVEDARIYNVGVSNVSQSANNFSATSTAMKTLGFTYTKLNQETFSSSHSWKVKASVTMKAKIPVFAQDTIKFETSFEGPVNWSSLKETTEEISSFYNVEVPPMTRVVVNMRVRRGSIDVPFSYTQRDILLDGRIVTHTLHDGLFTGVNTEMIDYTINKEPISEEEARLTVSSKI